MHDEQNRTGVVTKPYRQPYPDPIRVSAGERVTPDFAKTTDLPGWAWCTDDRGRSGWAPLQWLERDGDGWRITHDFNALELTVELGDVVTVHTRLAGFYRLTTRDGRTGWVPCDHIHIDD